MPEGKLSMRNVQWIGDDAAARQYVLRLPLQSQGLQRNVCGIIERGKVGWVWAVTVWDAKKTGKCSNQNLAFDAAEAAIAQLLFRQSLQISHILALT